MDAYDAKSIKVLKGLEAVKKRPGMYIGDISDGSGLHQMVFEVVDNAIDEALAGWCKNINVIIHENNSITVQDDGRGIPVDYHEEENMSAAEVIMTQLHAGGKFDDNSYKVSGGLHGVGVSVVNALSSHLELTVHRDKAEYTISFKDGIASSSLENTGKKTNKTGTKITFLPSREIFESIDINFSVLENRFREMAFLNHGISIILTDERVSNSIKISANNSVDDESDENNDDYTGINNDNQNESKKTITFHSQGGLNEFVGYLDRNKEKIHKNTLAFSGEDKGIKVEIALQWNDSYTENILCFTNNIRQRSGGTHLIGFKSALTRAVSAYMDKMEQDKNTVNLRVKVPKKGKLSIVGEDIREGLTAVISVKVPDPSFSSQVKDKLVTAEVRGVVEGLANNKISELLEENPAISANILNKILLSASSREAAINARKLIRNKANNTMQIATLPGKLASCQEKRPEFSELFIVEGDSAGGPAKQGRDRKTQAVLPIRGKILNVERVRIDKILSSPDIGNIITALEAGIGEDFNIENLRYHKIIIMTDADVDGSHIRSLLLTFFFRYMRPIVENGHIYIARPPLYKIMQSGEECYLQDEDAFKNYTRKKLVNNTMVNDIDQNDFLKFFDSCTEFIELITQYSAIPKNILEVLFLCIKEIKDKDLDSINKKLFIVFNTIYTAYVKDETNFIMHYFINGISNKYTIPYNLFDEDILNNAYNTINSYLDIFYNGLLFKFKTQEHKVYLISEFVNKMNEYSNKGLKLQRFKGLGEMNSDQLRETTLEVHNRKLTQVTIGDFEIADDMFTTLMGSLVAPRKEYILTHANDCIDMLDV